MTHSQAGGLAGGHVSPTPPYLNKLYQNIFFHQNAAIQAKFAETLLQTLGHVLAMCGPCKTVGHQEQMSMRCSNAQRSYITCLFQSII